MVDDIHSAVDISNLIKSRKISCTEVLDDCIQKIESKNKSINAFSYTDYEYAKKKAAIADSKLMSGDAKGHFFGIPTAAKDFFPSIPGWPTTYGGVKCLSKIISTSYNLYTLSMVNSGAIFVGRTNSPSFGFRGTTDNKMFGATSTPFKPGYNSGGSSGGSGAAVGANILKIAEGSDAGGSIRVPAAWCNSYGFKASAGTIPVSSKPNVYNTMNPYCFDGCITQTVKDSAYCLQLLSKYDPYDPTCIDFGKRDFISALNNSIKGKKVAYTSNFGIFPVDSEIINITRASAMRLKEAGAEVEEVDFKFNYSAYELSELWCRCIMINTMEIFENFKKQGIDMLKDHRDELPEQLIFWLEDTYKRTYLDLQRDQVMKSDIFIGIQKVFNEYDYIISPVTICHPVKNTDNTVGPSEYMGQKIDPLLGFALTFFYNLTGHPACSIPAGMSVDGFPVGMQIASKLHHDEELIAISSTFEKIQPWC